MHTLPSYFRCLSILAAALLACSQSALGVVYPMPAHGEDVVGENVTVRAGDYDSVLTIADRYDIGMHEILEANPNLGISPNDANRRLPAGTSVVVPTQFVLPPFRKGIVINMSELRLYYFTADGQQVYTYPVAMGRDAWRTPLLVTSVAGKTPNPTWHVPASIRKHTLATTGERLPEYVKPGPKNPLGAYAIRLSAPGYLIHGTNLQGSVGRYVSSGCIRMHSADIDELYHNVSPGTAVHIINFPDKVGWHDGQLYLEAHIPVELDEPAGKLNPGSLSAAIAMATKSKAAKVDLNKAQSVQARHNGMPEPIGYGGASHANNAGSSNDDDTIAFRFKQDPTDYSYNQEITPANDYEQYQPPSEEPSSTIQDGVPIYSYRPGEARVYSYNQQNDDYPAYTLEEYPNY